MTCNRVIVLSVISEYSNVFTESRRLKLLEEWLNLLKEDTHVLFKAKYVGLLCNSTTKKSIDKGGSFSKSGLRVFINLRRPALIHVLIFGIYHAISSLRSLVRIYKIYRRPVYVLLYATEYVPWLYLLPLYIVLKYLGRIMHVKVLLVHDYVDLYLKVYRYNRIEKFLYNILESMSFKLSTIFYSSASLITGYLLSRGVKRDKIIYFPPSAGREFQRLRKNRDLHRGNNEKIVFVYVGNIVEELSSLSLILETLSSLDESERSKIHVNLVLLVGKDKLRDLETLYRNLKDRDLENIVKVRVNAPLHEVAEIISNSHIGLALLNPEHPTTKQTDLPLKVAEYLCSGIPVIYTNFGRVRFFLKHGFHGLMVEHNVESVKDVVRYILLNPDVINELMNNVYKVREHFCLSTVAGELLIKTLKRFLQ